MSLSRARLSSLVGFVALALGAWACSDSPIGPKEPDLPGPGRLGVTPKVDTIFVTDSFTTSLQLTPTLNIHGSPVATPQDPRTVKWSSLDTAVAVVDGTGQVFPRGLGTATIRAEAGGQDADARITVVYATGGLTVSATELRGVVGDTARLSAQYVGPAGSVLPGVEYTFTSSNPAVVAVEPVATGQVRVRFLRSGSAQITVTALDQQATVNATVVPPRLEVSATTLTGVAGDSVTVTARALNLSGQPVANVTYVFTSSDPTIATVTQVSPGVAIVRFLRGGTVTITVTANEATGTPGGFTVLPQAVALVDAGGDHSCGIIGLGTTPGLGRLYCWGLGESGQLGVPGDSVCFDDVIAPAIPPLRCELSPKRAAQTLIFTSITAGERFSCGTVTGTPAVNGTGYCWGLNDVGQLGNGRVSAFAAPTLVTGALRFAGISAGGSHACGILLDRTVAYCWGLDDRGQLGDASVQRGVISTTPIPVVVPGGLTPTELPLTQVSAGFRHTCGVSPTNAAWCWGENASGQLGNGTTAPADPNAVAPPSQVGGGLSFRSVAAGGNHSCGLTTAGAAFCWGSNVDGQLGSGATGGGSNTPVAVTGGLTFSQIAAGDSHTCGLTAAGQAYCWGRNQYGQVGYGGASTGSPTPVLGGLTFTSISAGRRHTCAVAAGSEPTVGTWCWGGNLFGALGNQLQAAARGTPVKANPLQ